MCSYHFTGKVLMISPKNWDVPYFVCYFSKPRKPRRFYPTEITGRQFVVEVDPRGLQSGAHYAEDSKVHL